MARWDFGYVTDVAYTLGVYQETMPSWLAAASALLGHRPPDLGSPFRFADIGCGNGLNALVVAAANPQAEVWGFDFNPTHIENATNLATQAGLTNAHFEEISFEALAHGDTSKSGEAFDMMVAHGILSWVSVENRRHLTAVLARRLRPGGLAYISYNVATGWSGVAPLQVLMRQIADTSLSRTDRSVPESFQLLDQLFAAGAVFFRAHPGLEGRLGQMKAQDPRYLAHEFLNREWHAVMFSEVADAMAETKTSYIGSATVLENIDSAAVPEGVLPILVNVRDQLTRETIRDIASAKGFRRDLWRKGGERLGAHEQLTLLDAMTLVWTGKAVEAEVTFPGPIGSVTGQADFYHPLLNAIVERPTTLAQLRAMPVFHGRQATEFVQAVILLIGGGFALPAWPSGTRPEAREACARLNATIVSRLRMGVDITRLAAPLVGSSVVTDVMEGLIIGQLLDGTAAEPEVLTDALIQDLARSGRSVLREGKPVADPGEARTMVGNAVRNVLDRRVALLRVMGVIN